ncbi:hypothetical protein ACVILK_000667 [Bradyrhizobium embrapense]
MTHAANTNARWSSPVARQAHNLKVGGSNPPCATIPVSERAVDALSVRANSVLHLGQCTPAGQADASVGCVQLPVFNSRGDTRGQVSDPAEAAGVRVGTELFIGHDKQPKPDSKSGPRKASGCPVFSGPAMSITAGQAPGPRDAFSIPTTALGSSGRPLALMTDLSPAHLTWTRSRRYQTLEGRGPAEDRTGGCLAARAVKYPARRGASTRALISSVEAPR